MSIFSPLDILVLLLLIRKDIVACNDFGFWILDFPFRNRQSAPGDPVNPAKLCQRSYEKRVKL